MSVALRCVRLSVRRLVTLRARDDQPTDQPSGDELFCRIAHSNCRCDAADDDDARLCLCILFSVLRSLSLSLSLRECVAATFRFRSRSRPISSAIPRRRFCLLRRHAPFAAAV